jgi:hypothetical protein
MIIHWVSLLVGLSMGLLPPRLFISNGCRYLTFEDLWTKMISSEQQTQRRRRWWKLPLIWIDPFRGYVVARYLIDSFEAAPDSTTFQRLVPTIFWTILVGLCLWVQTKGREAERETLSPAAFLAGALFAILPPTVSVAGMVMGVATTLAMQGYAAGYLVATLTTAAVGYVFMRTSPTLAAATGIMALPLFFNWFRGTRMVMPMRC